MKKCEICSKLTIKILELRQYFTLFSDVSIVDFEQVNVCWNMITIYEFFYEVFL